MELFRTKQGSTEASLVAQTVKNLPAMWETWVRSLGWEDPLEEGLATHSRIRAWRIPWTEAPGGWSAWGHKELGTTERLSTAQQGGKHRNENPGGCKNNQMNASPSRRTEDNI